jgi:hypothetical protein
MSGLGSIIQPTQKPTCPNEPAAPASSVRGEAREEYQTTHAQWIVLKTAYDRKLAI